MPAKSNSAGVKQFIDAGLARDIAATMAIDEHAHPLPLGMEPEGDPQKPIQPYDLSMPIRLRPTNPEYVDAWAALWGYEHRDFELKHLQDLMQRKKSVVMAQGPAYNVWVLDQLKIETMITMAYGPGPSEPAPRFRFCGFCDWLLWPVPTIPAPDYGLIKNYFVVQQRMFGEIGCAALPATLDLYVSDVIEPIVAYYRRHRAVGLKFQTPYYRDLEFRDVAKQDAASLYAKGFKQGGLAPNELKALQDHIFRQIMRCAGETNEIVQMHTGLGVRPHFDVAGSNPLLMEPIFHDFKNTRFLLLHGGWPFDREVVALLSLDNVFTDFSCANIYKYARELSHQIRPALEWFPEKIMYGTDAYSDRSIGMLAGVPVKPNPLSGWEEKAWLMDRVGRDALGLALTGMMEDGVVTGVRASELARMVMRETAVGVYGLR